MKTLLFAILIQTITLVAALMLGDGTQSYALFTLFWSGTPLAALIMALRKEMKSRFKHNPIMIV